MFRAHLTEDVKAEAKRDKTTLAVIPGGLTSVLQPLDVCLNKPFKDRLRKMWQEWMCSDQVQTTKGGNLKKPDIEVVAKWVKDAWDSIPADMVRRSFLKCSISNALDGTEDDALLESGSEAEDDEQDNDVYADDVTEADFHALFGESDDDESEFDGF